MDEWNPNELKPMLAFGCVCLCFGWRCPWFTMVADDDGLCDDRACPIAEIHRKHGGHGRWTNAAGQTLG